MIGAGSARKEIWSCGGRGSAADAGLAKNTTIESNTTKRAKAIMFCSVCGRWIDHSLFVLLRTTGFARRLSLALNHGSVIL
jgi:hypothetical protein